MNRKRTLIWIPVLVGLTLAILLLVASSVAARPPSPVPAASNGLVPSAGTAAAPTFWSSGWVAINQNQTLTFNHNLGHSPEEYAAELWFRDTDDDWGINRRNYGGLEVAGVWFGAYWQNLTANTIEVVRLPGDNAADLVRVTVWVPPAAPDYDSGWTSINPGETKAFVHNQNTDVSQLTLALWFSGTKGIHHYAYGGLAQGNPPTYHGAYWHNMDSTTVKVTRMADDTDVEQVRVMVVHGDPPHADSGFQPVAPGTVYTFTHNLNWSPDMLLVRGECYQPGAGGLGVHQKYAGGTFGAGAGGGFQGAYIQNLTRNTVEMVRRLNDTVCPQVRVIISKRSIQVYVPLVLRNYQ